MSSTIVYKATAKAIRKGVMTADDRLILLGDGTAMLFCKGHLIQSDVTYKGKDSHIVATDEPLPEALHITKRELAHIQDNAIAIPVPTLILTR